MKLIILGTSNKGNQTVFVCNYCMLECIFEVNMSSKQIVPFVASVLYSRRSLIINIYFICSSVYMSMPICQFFHPYFPTLYPYACSLHLCLYFCFAFWQLYQVDGWHFGKVHIPLPPLQRATEARSRHHVVADPCRGLDRMESESVSEPVSAGWKAHHFLLCLTAVSLPWKTFYFQALL